MGATCGLAFPARKFFPLALGLLSLSLLTSKARSADDAPASDNQNTTASVQTATIRSGDISENLTLYGSVAPEPGALTILSQPTEVRVVKLHMVAGQRITKHTALMDVEPSLDAKLQYQDAKDKLEAAKTDLANTQQRFNLKLATNTELLAAQHAVKSAQLTLDSLEQRGASAGVHPLLAPADVRVSKVDVQEGQIVPAGTAMAELVPEEKIGVLVGALPEAVAQLKLNQGVQLFLAGRTQAVAGKIRAIGRSVNPETRLVNVFVAPSQNTPLLLNSFAHVEVALRTEHALLVPRSAVLPDDQGNILFTVKDSHAVKHTVQVGIENDNEVGVSAEGLKAGDTVVTEGNLELDDGMAVAVEQSK